ncbi:preprotein translocase subunit YajC [Aquabacterium sp.]|uniref:preprotein translocase subunit YajC n=1 Tax=Aquabacterium sp. TaxID=1872578 RepID=UPI0035AE564D
MFISSAYAQTAGAPAAQGGIAGLLNSPLPMLVLMFVAMYFIVLRPQMKRQKELKNLLDNLAKGDEVVTTGGLLGKITKINETMLSLEIASNVEVQVQRAAVVQVLPKGSVK